MTAFANFRAKAYPHHYAVTLVVTRLVGGIPTDPKVAEGWIRTKLTPKEELLQQMVAETMVDRGVTAEEAAEVVARNKHLNGFKRDPEHGLFIEGRQVKAALKEATMVAANAGKITAKKWGSPDDGNYKKGIKGWFPEHVFVVEDRIYLGVHEPDGVEQRFTHTHNGSGIQYEEYLTEAEVNFTVVTDHLFTDEQWAMIWLTGENQGLGAGRSMGNGRYVVKRWEKVS